MIRFRIDEAKGLFFDRAAVMSAVDRAAKRTLSRIGAFIRTTARDLIRKARRKSAGEMTSGERASHERQVRTWTKGGKSGPRPRRPSAPSKPGEPPRSITGLLRKFLFFVYDPSTKSVVVGPAKINSGSDAPHVLESGGTAKGRGGKTVRIAPRPYMGPAYQKNQPKIAEMWRDSVQA